MLQVHGRWGLFSAIRDQQATEDEHQDAVDGRWNRHFRGLQQGQGHHQSDGPILDPDFDGNGQSVRPTDAEELAAGEARPDADEVERDRGRTGDRKSTRLNSSHTDISRMPSSA